MALQKQPISLNFGQGLDTKSDSNQVAIGKFLALNNMVFGTVGRMIKRNGYGILTTLPSAADQTVLTTLNDNLITTGSDLYAYSEDTNQWLNQGIVQPVQLTTLPLLRVSTSQSSPDAAVAANGLVCLAYIDNGKAYYQISDSVTGQQVVQRTLLASTAAQPRVFMLQNYFIVTYLVTSGGGTNIDALAISSTNLVTRGNITVGSSVNGLTAGYDGVVFDDNLYLAWTATTSSIDVAYVTPSLVASPPSTISGHSAALMSVTADPSTNYIWVSFWSSTTYAYTTSFTPLLTSTSGVTQIASGVNLTQMTSVAQDGVLSLFFENANTYPYTPATPNYPSTVSTDYLSIVTYNGTTVAGPTTFLRSVGLASKAFIDPSGTIYMLTAYGEPSQPTYFLIDSTGNIYMRLAYSNGGGLDTGVLPTVSVNDGLYQVPYLYKDFLTTLNKGSTIVQSGVPVVETSIYSQTGVNLASFTINDSSQYSSEIASALHLTGGQLWEYDGVKPVEHNFHVWPETIGLTTASTGGILASQEYFYQFTYEWTDNAGNLHRSAPSIPVSITTAGTAVTFSSVFAAGATSITVSSASGLAVRQVISDNTTAGNIAANTYITSISGTTIGLSQPTQGASAASPGDTLTTSSTSVNTLKVPTLRLTYKQPFDAPTSPLVTNPVRIVGYRWSQAQQIYYQFTSVTSPILNDTTIDYVTITDNLADSQILGNAIIYTTGGVVEDIAAPASIASTLYKNRLFLIDAEDQNLLWYSKQVIEAVPVEMSDLLTLYVAPTTGTQGSTGPCTALSAMDDKLIVFKRNAAYYITGTGPDNTGSNNDFSDPIFITSSVGCDNPDSIVLMQNGLMFQSAGKGIWLLGRDLSTSYIGAPVEEYNDRTVLSAQSIPGTNQIRFILDNGITLMYDYYVQQWGTFNNVNAISSTLQNNLHTYLNDQGIVFQETPGAYLDGSTPVLTSFTTSWISAAGLQGYERFYQLLLLGNYFTPFKLQVQLAYDYNPSSTQSTIVTPDNYGGQWGSQNVWGAGNAWGGAGQPFEARVFPQTQKCETFQVSVNELYDPSLGVAPGEGLSLSGMNLLVGVKKGVRTSKASRSFG